MARLKRPAEKKIFMVLISAVWLIDVDAGGVLNVAIGRLVGRAGGDVMLKKFDQKITGDRHTPHTKQQEDPQEER